MVIIPVAILIMTFGDFKLIKETESHKIRIMKLFLKVLAMVSTLVVFIMGLNKGSMLMSITSMDSLKITDASIEFFIAGVTVVVASYFLLWEVFKKLFSEQKKSIKESRPIWLFVLIVVLAVLTLWIVLYIVFAVRDIVN